METKELKIQIPEGYCIDESKSTFEKIIFKKKDTKPRSWEDYCRQQKIKGAEGYLIDSPCADICWCYWSTYDPLPPITWRNVLPSKELAEAFLTMMQLMSLRQAWIGDWKPDWNDFMENKYCILHNGIKFIVGVYSNARRALSFPTKEMAEDFMNTFKDLLETAKPLI